MREGMRAGQQACVHLREQPRPRPYNTRHRMRRQGTRPHGVAHRTRTSRKPPNTLLTPTATRVRRAGSGNELRSGPARLTRSYPSPWLNYGCQKRCFASWALAAPVLHAPPKARKRIYRSGTRLATRSKALPLCAREPHRPGAGSWPARMFTAAGPAVWRQIGRMRRHSSG